jgi:hypothetical protein
LFQLKFYWRSPLSSECKRFNGELTGYFFILKGASPWVLAEEERSGTSLDNSIEFQVMMHLDRGLKLELTGFVQNLY